MITSEKIAKLPKWAQHELDRLTRDLAAAYVKLNAGPKDSDTFADPHSSSRRPLGRGPTIEFSIGQGWHNKIQARLTDDGKLLVSGGTTLAVMPRASNEIEIEVKR